jgi:hypothetical protein
VVSAQEERLEVRSRELLQQSAEYLDAHTLSKLTQARHAALDELQRARAYRMRRVMIPAGSLAAVALVAVVMWSGFTLRGGNGLPEATSVDDVELVADEDNVDLMSDLDFYSWVGSQTDAPDDGNAG